MAKKKQLTKKDIKLEDVPEGVEIRETPTGRELHIRPDDTGRGTAWLFAFFAISIFMLNVYLYLKYRDAMFQFDWGFMFVAFNAAAGVLSLFALYYFSRARRQRNLNYIVQLPRGGSTFSVAEYLREKKQWEDTFDWLETTVELPHEIARARPPTAKFLFNTSRMSIRALVDACDVDGILKDIHEKKLAEDAESGEDLKGRCVILRFRAPFLQRDISGLKKPKAYWLKLFLNDWEKTLGQKSNKYGDFSY